MYLGNREKLKKEDTDVRFEEFPTGFNEGFKSFSYEEAEKFKAEHERELLLARSTLEIRVYIEDSPSGGFKVVDRSSYVKSYLL